MSIKILLIVLIFILIWLFWPKYGFIAKIKQKKFHKINNINIYPPYANSLATLPLGESATITGISSSISGIERRRLLDLGFIKGAIVTAEMISPSASPIAYKVKGKIIALRKEQTSQIYIEEISNDLSP